jgi:hypothetical protein
MWSIARQPLQSLELVNTKACSPALPEIQIWCPAPNGIR